MPETSTKALTISQPYASLIAEGRKFVENRRWPTSYRGRLVIHAGKGTQYLTRDELQHYPSGCVVAVANLVACLHRDEIVAAWSSVKPNGCSYTYGEILEHEHTEGPWCWILEDVNKIYPTIPMRGAQGLWDCELEAPHA